MSVATVLRKLSVVASGTPSSSLTERHNFRKLFGSRRVPPVYGKITGLLAEIGQVPTLLQHLDGEPGQGNGAAAGD